MAQFERPPDPRKGDLRQWRERHQQQPQRQPVPWLWLGFGVLVTIAGVLLALAILNRFLAVPPLSVAAVPTPTVIFLSAPPSPTPTATPILPTPTPIPTLTPVPTPDLRTPPPEVTVGYYAQVTGTNEFGVTVRGGPNTTNLPLAVAQEGERVLVIGGPREGGEFVWWQIRLADATEGWVAGNFLRPAGAP